MNAWDRVEEVGDKTESFTKVIQAPKETFKDFLQRVTSTVNRMIPNSEARQKIMEPLTFKNANIQYKRVIVLLKARSAHLEE